MGRTLKIIAVTTAGGLAPACILLGFDLRRKPCERYVWSWLPVVVGVVSPGLGGRLAERLWIQNSL